MAIRYSNLDSTLQGRLASEDRGALLPYVPTQKALNVLLAPSNITADDTVVIGGVTFQCKALTTSSTRTCSLDNVSTPSLLTASGTMTWAAGDLLRIDNEIVKILELVTGYTTTKAVVLRARCGTSAASHSTATIYQASSVHATHVPFGVNATLTPAVWVPSLAAEINNAASGGRRASAKASTLYDPGSTYTDAQRAGKVVAIAKSDRLILKSAIGEDVDTACTDGLTAAGNVWISATMFGGSDASERRIFAAARVPTAGEVTGGSIDIPLDFSPSVVIVRICATATGAETAWDGGWAYDDTNDILTIDKSGTSDWAATDTLHILAIE